MKHEWDSVHFHQLNLYYQHSASKKISSLHYVDDLHNGDYWFSIDRAQYMKLSLLLFSVSKCVC